MFYTQRSGSPMDLVTILLNSSPTESRLQLLKLSVRKFLVETFFYYLTASHKVPHTFPMLASFSPDFQTGCTVCATHTLAIYSRIVPSNFKAKFLLSQSLCAFLNYAVDCERSGVHWSLPVHWLLKSRKVYTLWYHDGNSKAIA